MSAHQVKRRPALSRAEGPALSGVEGPALSRAEGRLALARRAATVGAAAAMIAATGILTVANAPVRLVGISSQGNAVLIEASEPAPEKRHARAWHSFCQVLFAGSEFVYLN